MTRTTLIRLLVAAAAALAAFAVGRAGVPVVSFLAKVFLFFLLAGLALWLLVKIYQGFLWKVGRRLAFSYFLLGVLPIPMVALLALGVGYVLATFFLGHLYRDVAGGLQARLVERAEQALEGFAAGGRPGPAEKDGFAFDYFRSGKRVGGAGAAPESWPAWLTEGPAAADGEVGVARFVTRRDGAATLAVAVEKGDFGVTAVHTGELATALRKEGGFWVQTAGPEARSSESDVVVFQDREVRFRVDTSPPETGEPDDPVSEERQEFFRGRAEGDGYLDRPLLAWPQVAGPLLALESGETVVPQLEIVVMDTPRQVMRRLASSSAEQSLVAWVGLVIVSVVLLTVYAAAALVAVAMIFGLSRAVNRLSRATAAVQKGDFSVRIPVRRRDQVGALQRSFNDMASHLEELVATAAQKEILEKELAIARELQESLLPRDLPQGEAVEFATLFQPSAAIGGDYFDILRLDEEHLAVVIADVSGHGLSSGLRMAMLKAALLILVEQKAAPEEILRRLDALVRAQQDQHFFVTATLGWIDLAGATLTLINAGHPPTYLLRRGGVREIILPGSPLGGLGDRYGRETVRLEPDDLVVWLSDGFVEAPNAAGDPFGYEAVTRALAGEAATPVEVRNRLLAAVERHTAGRPAEDDCTLVVMRYRAASGAAAGEADAAATSGALSASPSVA